MTKLVINGFDYDLDMVKGVCAEHRSPLIDSPHIINNVEVTDEQREFYNAGLWGIAFCPIGRHFEVWTLPEFDKRPGATEDNPFAEKINEALDKLPDE